MFDPILTDTSRTDSTRKGQAETSRAGAEDDAVPMSFFQVFHTGLPGETTKQRSVFLGSVADASVIDGQTPGTPVEEPEETNITGRAPSGKDEREGQTRTDSSKADPLGNAATRIEAGVEDPMTAKRETSPVTDHDSAVPSSNVQPKASDPAPAAFGVTEIAPANGLRRQLANDIRAGSTGNRSQPPVAGQTPIPHADGSKGPAQNADPAEDSTMQLIRANRSRSLPSGFMRSALVDGTAVTSPAVATGENTAETPPVRPVSPARRAMRDTSDQAERSVPEKLLRRADVSTAIQAKLAQPISVSGTGATAARQPAAQVHPLHTSPHPVMPAGTAPHAPLVLATYGSVAQQTAAVAAADSARKARADVAIEQISRAQDLGLSDGPVRPGPSVTGSPALPHASATAEQIATQIAQLAQNSALHRRDILLNPEELGRVRLSLSAQDTAVHVAILVERPETLDLMRRYIGQLTNEFRALGYDDVSFEFTQHEQSTDGETDTSPETGTRRPSDPTTDDPLMPVPPPARALPSNATLDLRI